MILSTSERRALRRALPLLELNRTRFALAVLAGTFGLGSAIALSAVSGWLIARASQQPDVVALGVAPVAVRLFGISRAVLRYVERLLSHSTALRGMTSLRARLYDVLASSRTDTVAGLRRGDVLARVGADVDAVGDLVVRSYLPILVALCVGVGTSVGIAIVSLPAGLILASCLLISGIVGPLATIRSARVAERARTENAAALAETSMTLVESAGELNISGRSRGVFQQLAQIEQRLVRTKDAAARPAALAATVDILATGAATLGAILVGIPAVEAGQMAPVMLPVIVLTPLAAFEATQPLGPASVQLVRSAAAAQRIIKLLDDAEASTANIPQEHPLPTMTADGPRLCARDLSIGWPGGPVVASGINLELIPGKRLALVGPSGIGKTTLLYTLAGLLEPRGGELTLDGVSPWGAPRTQVSERISVTAEDAHIFDTTVLENLRVARGDVTEQQAQDLLAQAGLGQWLAGLPQGLETVVGAGASGISGGERRRLLLARALAAPAPLMALDEPGEHLDPATADALVGDLLRADSQRGVLLVTHRLSALGEADEVLQLGKPTADGPATVVHRGTHAQLLSAAEDYSWAVSQENAGQESPHGPAN